MAALWRKAHAVLAQAVEAACVHASRLAKTAVMHLYSAEGQHSTWEEMQLATEFGNTPYARGGAQADNGQGAWRLAAPAITSIYRGIS
jgi:hypothetical protein